MTLHVVLRTMEALDELPVGSWIGIVRRETFEPYEKDSDGQWWGRCGSVSLDTDRLLWGARILHLPGMVEDAPHGHEQPWEHEGHRETQHRDGRAPWCGLCGWSAPVPARPAVQVRIVQDVLGQDPDGPAVVDIETGGRT